MLSKHIFFYFIRVIIVRTLDKLHAKHVLPGFSDRSQEERDIEALTTDITKVCASCSEFQFSSCLLSSQGLPFLSVPHSKNSKCTAPVSSRSSKVLQWDFTREECRTWPRRQGSGSQCHLSQKATCVHGKYVFSYHSSSFIIFFSFLPDLKYYFRIIWQSISSRVPHLTLRPLYNLLTVIGLELQGHATKNQDLLLASGTISLKGSDGLNAVDDDIIAAVSFGSLLFFHLPPIDSTFIVIFISAGPPRKVAHSSSIPISDSNPFVPRTPGTR